MTPVLPGGENGGAKLVAMGLLRGFRTMAAGDRFLILTASWNHEELAEFEHPDMRRLCVVNDRTLSEAAAKRSPGRIERVLRRGYRFLRQRYRENFYHAGPLASRGVDLLFCPFSSITHAEPGIPAVSAIHDLQHKEYPQFFTPQEIDIRDSFFADVCRKADAVICVSEYTRQSLLRHLQVSPEKTFTVHNCIHSRLSKRETGEITAHLANLGIDGRPYMFYPANFWPHKNHRLLITAYGMYLSRNPDRRLDLVFTGALDGAQRDLKDQANRMGLKERIHFLGYLAEDQLTSVWQRCSFLVFPSLYEGFGIPVLEAMQFGKPVLCSNVSSLPEVAGDAALYFDPRKPHEIVQCMERIVEHQYLAASLVSRGYDRLSHFQTPAMVNNYLTRLKAVLRHPRKTHNEISGVYADGWTGRTLQVIYGADPSPRVLELHLEVPAWFPHKKAIVRLADSTGRKQKWTIERGSSQEITVPLPEKGNDLLFSIESVFIPSECNMGADGRTLGIVCRGCHLTSHKGERKTLWPPKE